jgi:putative ABC transport system ATP-binding protein
VIEARSLTKSYGPRAQEVLRGITLQVARAESAALMGPSGSGKSTLLHLLGALDTPTEGEVRIGGERLSGLSDEALSAFRRKHLGFVFQFFNLAPTLTAAENVELPLLLDGVPPRERRQRALTLLDRMGLGSKSESYPAELSGGEMQRIAVARALVARPWVVLADEPTGSLDSAQGAEVLELLLQTTREQGASLFLVTHDAAVAARCHRTLRLLDGRLSGEP